VNQLGPWPHPSLSHSLHIPLGHSLQPKLALARLHFPLRPHCRSGPTRRRSCPPDTATGRWRSRARLLERPHRRRERECRLSPPPSGASVCGGARWWSSCRSWAWPRPRPYSSWRTPKQDWEQGRCIIIKDRRHSWKNVLSQRSFMLSQKSDHLRKRPAVVPGLRPPVFGAHDDCHLKHCGEHHMCHHP